MKYTTSQGEVIEGTPQELAKFRMFDTIAQPTPTPVQRAPHYEAPRKQVAPIVCRPYAPRLSDESVNALAARMVELLKNSEQPLTETALMQVAYGKQSAGPFKRISAVLLKTPGVEKVGTRFVYSKSDEEFLEKRKRQPYRISDENREKLRARSLWLQNHVRILMRVDNRLGFAEAMRRAGQAWKVKQGTLPPGTQLNKSQKEKVLVKQGYTFVDKFPSVNPIAAGGIAQLEALVQHALGSTSAKITLRDMWHVENVYGHKWDGNMWREFLVDFIMNHKTVLNYFNAKGKFVVQKDSEGYEVLVWQKSSSMEEKA